MNSRAASPSLESLIATAHQVGEIAARNAAETERGRCLAPEAADALIHSGLIKILQPARWGGYELGFPEFVRVTQAIARHDVSAGWLHAILGIHHWWGAFTSPELQDELWGKDPDTLFVDSFAPFGQARPVAGGMRLSGKWGFLSGVPWAKWVAVGGIAPLAEGAEPEYLMFFVPQGDYAVLDDWHTMGLRGSASCSVEVNDAFIPAHRVFRMGYGMATGDLPGLSINPGVSYRVSFVGGLGVALVAPSLGGSQALAQRFLERAKSRVPLFSAQRQAELVVSQTTLAEQLIELEMVEGLVYRYADDLMDHGTRNAPYSVLERVQMFAWRALATRRCREANHKLIELAGSSGIFEHEPIQRYFRDVHAMGQHIAVNYEAGLRNYGRVLLGLEPDAVLY